MPAKQSSNTTIRTIRFHAYGEPGDVLRLERTDAPSPVAGRIRVAVHACGLTPADWALCRGLAPGALPRGIGLDVSGVVDAVGEGVTDVTVGDRVLGGADFAGAPVAGASDVAILSHWARMPANLGFAEAAALPMAVGTAAGCLDLLHLTAGQTLMVHGAGTTVGFAAVQMALLRGIRVFATAGDTHREQLSAMGAKVTAYGEGLADRVLALAGGPLQQAFDTAPVNLSNAVSGALPELVRVVGGDPRRVLTCVDFDGGAALGIRTSRSEQLTHRYDLLGEFAQLAAEGRFSIPIARTFALEEWRTAMDSSLSGHAHGKLLLLP